MCGIIGYVGNQEAVPILIGGLSKLEYRGYDSSGVAVLQGEKIAVKRSVGKLVNLQNALKANGLNGTVGIGHTRWATHGKPSEQNAHPHRSKGCVLVHNGIIENYQQLKQQLEKDGYKFVSETDTEVVAHLIDKYLQQGNKLADAVRLATKDVKGSYALAVMSEREPGTLIAARSGCPLVVGRTAHASYIASDVMAMLAHTREVTYLEEGDVAVVTQDDVQLTDSDGRAVSRKASKITWDASAAEKSGYPHFMLKEIHEQPQTILDTMRGRYSYETGEADLPDIGLTPKEFASLERIWIVACGTSWHAGQVGKYLFEEMVRTPVQVDIGSEFRYRDPLVGKKDLFITISQSGETADTLAAAREAKAKGARVVSIVNVVGSTLARESDGVLYTHCGPEIGVASTKAFTAQLTALYLLALHFARVRNVMKVADGQAWLDRLVRLPVLVESVLQREAEIVAIAKRYYKKRNFLFLGRGINYPIALEGALKLKEISYIHAEAYPAGELKHGPLALVDAQMPVVAIAPNDALLEKLKSNLQEVRARGGELYVVADLDSRLHAADGLHVIRLPEHAGMLSPIVHVVPLQLLAYHAAVIRGTDVDKPRNLAKSVTVE